MAKQGPLTFASDADLANGVPRHAVLAHHTLHRKR
jgi:hypothetical protein